MKKTMACMVARDDDDELAFLLDSKENPDPVLGITGPGLDAL